LSRDFAVIVERARAAASLQVLGEVDGLPILAARIGEDQPQGLLIAGTHGDEPATVEAALQALERPVDVAGGDWTCGLSLEVLPCTNPTGYVRNTRETAQGVDVNWAWTRTDVAEIQILRRFLSGRRYQFVLDFHEDWETTGFYLYEHRHGVDAAGPKMIDVVEPIIPINAGAEIEGWPAVKGVVTADSSQERIDRGDGFPMVLLRDHTPHKLTTETPTELPIPLRAQAHLATLDALLEHYGDRL
jgi:protein MpaA